jgi:hypothetical protein
LSSERTDFGRGAQAAKPLVGSRQQARGVCVDDMLYYELLLFTSRALNLIAAADICDATVAAQSSIHRSGRHAVGLHAALFSENFFNLITCPSLIV